MILCNVLWTVPHKGRATVRRLEMVKNETKIKVFEVGSGDDECVKRSRTVGDVLEERVNAWLEGQSIKVLQVVQSTNTSPGMASSTYSSVTLTIIYETTR